MAGMLPGVEAARRRRFHKNYGSETSTARRPSLSLYATTHDFLQNSSLQQRNPISNKELYDESRLDTAAREAKKRLDERLQSQTKRYTHKINGVFVYLITDFLPALVF